MKQMSWVLIAGLLFFARTACAAEGMIRVAILDGQSAGAYHNWRLTTPVLKKELEETGLFEVTVITAPPSDGDFSNFKPDFETLPGDRDELRRARLAGRFARAI